MKLYAELTKTEKQPDGTLHVWGYASADSVDAAGEIVTADAMKAALPDYMKFGNVREMHQLSAVGTALEATVQADGRTFFGAHVVDPVAVKKVETGVYKGFSIGGKVTSRDEMKKTTVTGIRLNEISLVDRPCNPDAVVTLFKIENPAADVDDLAKLLDAGTISPARLLELAEADALAKASEATGGPATPAADPVATEEKVAKGMWTLQDFAGILSCLSAMALGAQDEAAWEGDDSPIPAQLREWVATGVQIFQAMTVEESNELLAAMKVNEPPAVETIILAQHVEDLKKVETARDEALAKVQGEHNAVLKAIGTAAGAKEGDVVVNVVAKLASDHADLTKRFAALQAMPAPGKALLKAIGKGGDIVAPAAAPVEIAPITDAFGAQNEVATLIKAVHAQGPASIT